MDPVIITVYPDTFTDWQREGIRIFIEGMGGTQVEWAFRTRAADSPQDVTELFPMLPLPPPRSETPIRTWNHGMVWPKDVLPPIEAGDIIMGIAPGSRESEFRIRAHGDHVLFTRGRESYFQVSVLPRDEFLRAFSDTHGRTAIRRVTRILEGQGYVGRTRTVTRAQLDQLMGTEGVEGFRYPRTTE